MTTFSISIVSSYSGSVICSAFNAASGRRQDYVPEYFSGNLTEEEALESNRGPISSLALFSFCHPWWDSHSRLCHLLDLELFVHSF